MENADDSTNGDPSLEDPSLLSIEENSSDFSWLLTGLGDDLPSLSESNSHDSQLELADQESDGSVESIEMMPNENLAPDILYSEDPSSWKMSENIASDNSNKVNVEDTNVQNDEDIIYIDLTQRQPIRPAARLFDLFQPLEEPEDSDSENDEDGKENKENSPTAGSEQFTIEFLAGNAGQDHFHDKPSARDLASFLLRPWHDELEDALLGEPNYHEQATTANSASQCASTSAAAKLDEDKPQTKGAPFSGTAAQIQEAPKHSDRARERYKFDEFDYILDGEEILEPDGSSRETSESSGSQESAARVDKLEQQLADLQAEVAQKNTLLAGLRGDLRKYGATIADLESQLQEYRPRARGFGLDNFQRLQKYQELIRLLVKSGRIGAEEAQAMAAAEDNTLTAENETKLITLIQLMASEENSMDRLRMEMEALKEERDMLAGLVDPFQEGSQEIGNNIAVSLLRSELQSVANERDLLQQTVASLESKISEVEAAIPSLTAAAAAAGAAAAIIVADANGSESEEGMLTAEEYISELLSEIDQLTAQILKLESESEQLKAQTFSPESAGFREGGMLESGYGEASELSALRDELRREQQRAQLAEAELVRAQGALFAQGTKSARLAPDLSELDALTKDIEEADKQLGLHAREDAVSVKVLARRIVALKTRHESAIQAMRDELKMAWSAVDEMGEMEEFHERDIREAQQHASELEVEAHAARMFHEGELQLMRQRLLDMEAQLQDAHEGQLNQGDAVDLTSSTSRYPVEQQHLAKQVQEKDAQTLEAFQAKSERLKDALAEQEQQTAAARQELADIAAFMAGKEVGEGGSYSPAVLQIVQWVEDLRADHDHELQRFQLQVQEAESRVKEIEELYSNEVEAAQRRIGELEEEIEELLGLHASELHAAQQRALELEAQVQSLEGSITNRHEQDETRSVELHAEIQALLEMQGAERQEHDQKLLAAQQYAADLASELADVRAARTADLQAAETRLREMEAVMRSYKASRLEEVEASTRRLAELEAQVQTMKQPAMVSEAKASEALQAFQSDVERIHAELMQAKRGVTVPATQAAQQQSGLYGAYGNAPSSPSVASVTSTAIFEPVSPSAPLEPTSSIASSTQAEQLARRLEELRSLARDAMLERDAAWQARASTAARLHRLLGIVRDVKRAGNSRLASPSRSPHKSPRTPKSGNKAATPDGEDLDQVLDSLEKNVAEVLVAKLWAEDQLNAAKGEVEAHTAAGAEARHLLADCVEMLAARTAALGLYKRHLGLGPLEGTAFKAAALQLESGELDGLARALEALGRRATPQLSSGPDGAKNLQGRTLSGELAEAEDIIRKLKESSPQSVATGLRADFSEESPIPLQLGGSFQQEAAKLRNDVAHLAAGWSEATQSPSSAGAKIAVYEEKLMALEKEVSRLQSELAIQTRLLQMAQLHSEVPRGCHAELRELVAMLAGVTGNREVVDLENASLSTLVLWAKQLASEVIRRHHEVLSQPETVSAANLVLMETQMEALQVQVRAEAHAAEKATAELQRLQMINDKLCDKLQVLQPDLFSSHQEYETPVKHSPSNQPSLTQGLSEMQTHQLPRRLHGIEDRLEMLTKENEFLTRQMHLLRGAISNADGDIRNEDQLKAAYLEPADINTHQRLGQRATTEINPNDFANMPAWKQSMLPEHRTATQARATVLGSLPSTPLLRLTQRQEMLSGSQQKPHLQTTLSASVQPNSAGTMPVGRILSASSTTASPITLHKSSRTSSPAHRYTPAAGSSLYNTPHHSNISPSPSSFFPSRTTSPSTPSGPLWASQLDAPTNLSASSMWSAMSQSPQSPLPLSAGTRRNPTPTRSPLPFRPAGSPGINRYLQRGM